MDRKTRDWLLVHHKDAHETELTRLEKLRDRVAFLSGPLTLLGSGLCYVWLNYPYQTHGKGALLFFGAAGVSTALFVIAVGMVLYSLARGYLYEYVPSPAALDNYVSALEHYNASHPPAPINVLDDLKAHMSDAYRDAATANRAVNDRRSRILAAAAQVAVVSLAAFLIGLSGFYRAKSREPNAPTKVTVTEPIRIRQ